MAVGYIWGVSLIAALKVGMQKTVILLFLLSLALAVPYFISKLKVQTIMTGLLLLFWLPMPIILAYFSGIFAQLYLFEFLIWFFLFYILSNKYLSMDTRISLGLKRFPLKPYLFYIGGALIAYFLSYKTGGELSIIRIICVFPMILSLSIFLTIESGDDAKSYLWAVLTAAFLLSLIFQFGPRFLPSFIDSYYRPEVGRAGLQIVIPYVGNLVIFAASAGDKFGFMFTLAFSFWLINRSFWIRIVAALMCLSLGAAMVNAQGRGGTIAALVSSSFIAYLSIKKGGRLRIRALVIYSIVGLSIIGATWYFAVQSESKSVTMRITSLYSDPFGDPNYLGRLEIWKRGLEIIQQRPMGIGLVGFESPGNDTWIVHNIWLYIFLSFGVIGFLGFVWLLSTFFKAFLKGIRNENPDINNLCVAGIGLLINLIIAGQFSPIVYEPYTVGIIWVPLATIYAVAVLDS